MSIILDIPQLILQATEEVYEIVSGGKGLLSMEQETYGVVSRLTRKLLTCALAERDLELSEGRDKKELRMVGKRTKSLMTPFGEIAFRRRYCRDTRTGQYRCLLDEELGLEPGRRLSPWMEQVLIRAAVDLPYHRTVNLLSAVMPGAPAMSAMAAWTAVQRAGSAVAREADERRKRLFEWGELPAGERKVESLGLEADEVVLRGRRDEQRWIGLKLAAAYEGKEETATGRRRLAERQITAVVGDGRLFWEHTLADTCRKWDLCSIQATTVGGDGAAWVKLGLEHFPGSVYRLDPYHLRRALRQALGPDSVSYGAVCDGIAGGDWPAVKTALTTAAANRTGNRRKQVIRLGKYLRANWDGIIESGEAQTLGAIEGQVFHHVARRMKRHGARWSVSGADNLAHLLAANANDELPVPGQHQPRIVDQATCRSSLPDRAVSATREFGNDPAQWLAASLPALTGPDADKPWVKWCLRQIAHIPKLA